MNNYMKTGKIISCIAGCILLSFGIYSFFTVSQNNAGNFCSVNNSEYGTTDVEYPTLPGENVMSFLYAPITETEKGHYGKGPGEKKKSGTKKSGPQKMREFFTELHYPLGEVLPNEFKKQLQNELNLMPADIVNQSEALYDNWVNIGPNGMPLTINPSMKYSGRIRDIEVNSAGVVKFAGASGGLWRISGSSVIEFGQGINSLWYGAIVTDPGNSNTILAGTGEPYVGPGGSGLWRTTNLGVNWTNIAMDPASPYPLSFYKLKFQPGSSTVVHAATGSGYQRSTNGGLSWTRNLTGIITDVVVNPSNTNMIFAGMEDGAIGGVYRSTNAGLTWFKITGTALPITDVGDVKLSVSNSSPNTMYACIVRRSTSTTYGIYKSTDGGTSWGSGSIYSGGDFHWGQGWYNNCIEVSPVNANNVILGGGGFLRTTNGGTNWLTLVGYPEFHADQHDVAWNAAGTLVYMANDGGLIQSTDAGATWSAVMNIPPITQFYGVSTPKNEKAVIIGGTQDNFVPISSNNGTSWWVPGGGDASGSAINPSNSNEMYFTNFFPTMSRYKTTNYGSSFSDFNTGIPSGIGVWGSIRQDIVPQIYLYTNQGSFVYRSIFPYSSWTQLNASAFPNSVSWLDVSRFNSTTVIYAALGPNPPASSSKLRVSENDVWSERSTGLPANANVRSVGQHPVNNNIAYAVMNGVSSPGQKIFKTTNRGTYWTNISGNIPNLPLTSLVPHPANSNLLFLSSENGCFRTTNGGTTWIRWNNGMHDNLLVSELTYIDSTAINGRFYIVAGTFGRGIYVRNATGEDQITSVVNTEIPVNFFLWQNSPNPFNPSTNIKFSIPKSADVVLIISDITGKTIRKEHFGSLRAGIHEYKFESTECASGVYFYTLYAGSFRETKKMLMIK